MKIKLTLLASPLVFVAPIALTACGTKDDQTTPAGMTEDELNELKRADAFKKLTPNSRYEVFLDNDGNVASEAVNYYDVLTRIYNNPKSGIIPNLTIAENYYNVSLLNGGLTKNYWNAKLFSEMIDKTAKADDGNNQSLAFEDIDSIDWSANDGFKSANAFKEWHVSKSGFLKDITIVDKIHDDIAKIVSNNQDDYMLYVPQKTDANGDYAIYLFKKAKTSQGIKDAWDYFKNNFQVSKNFLTKTNSTYTLMPTQRFTAMDKEVLTANATAGYDSNIVTDDLYFAFFGGANAAPMYGDAIPEPDAYDRAFGNNMLANFGIEFKGNDSKWTTDAMKKLENFTFNTTWIRDEKTFEEKLKVTIFENDKSDKWHLTNQEGTIDEEAAKINGMATFIFDGNEVMRFAENNSNLKIWSDKTGKVDHNFIYSESKLYQLVNSDAFSFDRLSLVLVRLADNLNAYSSAHLFETKTQATDLFALLSIVRPDATTNSSQYNLKDQATFTKFCQWVKTNHPEFSLATLQLILEQLNMKGFEFPASVADISPLYHMELQFVSQLYKMIIDFTDATAQLTQP